jgi:transposase
VPALPSSILEPLWVQVAALLPTRQDTHPLGCHRPRIADRVIFDKLIQVLVFGCGYRRIADHSCSATTLRRRRDEWIRAGVADQLALLVLAAYDRMHGLELEQLAVDGCTTKAPCGGQVAGPSPVDRRKQGLKRSVAVEAGGVPWRWYLPRPTSAMMGCWRPPWTPSPWSGRCPSGRWCTWTPATTTSPAGTSWPSAGWWARSPPVASQHRSRRAAGG